MKESRWIIKEWKACGCGIEPNSRFSIHLTDGEECPMFLWWPIMSEDYRQSFMPIAGFNNATNCIARKLNLSRSNFVGNKSNCPSDFQWRGIMCSLQFVLVS